MKTFTEITNEPKQKFVLVGEDNENINFSLRYNPTQMSWEFDLAFEDFTLNGKKITNSPNMLREHINVLNFGLGCNVSDGSEPYLLNDFSTGRATLYLLTESEVTQIEGAFF